MPVESFRKNNKLNVLMEHFIFAYAKAYELPRNYVVATLLEFTFKHYIRPSGLSKEAVRDFLELWVKELPDIDVIETTAEEG